MLVGESPELHRNSGRLPLHLHTCCTSYETCLAGVASLFTCQSHAALPASESKLSSAISGNYNIIEAELPDCPRDLLFGDKRCLFGVYFPSQAIQLRAVSIYIA